MNILVADDHAIVRKGLIELLREEFPTCNIFEAVNSTEVLQLIKTRTMDILLLDISMPGRNGIETLKQIRTNGVKTPVLMLSMHPEDQYAIRALKAGASGFMNKETATEELLTAVQSILKGKKYIPYSVAEKLLESNDHGNKQPHELLSDRELEVLQKIASGKTVSEIANQLSLSVNTISTYRARLLDKLGLTSNAALARYAIDHNLV
jgi:two-component system, NarL family, invasion response regulator UvrY